MKSIKNIPLLTTISIIVLIIGSCTPNFDDANWSTEVTTPIVSSSMNLGNLLSDSIIQTNPDSSLNMVFTNDIYSFTIDSLVEFRDTLLTYVANIENLELDDQVIVYPITLGQIASSPDAGQMGTLIIAMNGNSIPIDPIGDPNPISSGNIGIDANEYFQSMTLDSGYIDITLDNGLPIDITDLILELKNESNQEILVRDTFLLIPTMASETRSYPLHDRTIYGDLQAKIVEMSSPGSDGEAVLIDTTDALIATLTIRDLKPIEATAVFPSQNIIEKVDEMVFAGMGDIKLSYMRIRSALMRIEVISTIEDSMFFSYAIPSATFDGAPFSVDMVIPPAPPGDTAYFYVDYPFDGYDLDMTGIGWLEQQMGQDLDTNFIVNPDTINTFVQMLTGRIDSTGQLINLSLNDSIYINMGIIDLIADYGLGYLGKDTIDIGPNVSNFDMFNSITEGTIDFSQVDVTFEVSNEIGADAKIQFEELSSINTNTGNTVLLTNSDINNEIIINSAIDQNGSDPEFLADEYILNLNGSNSNVEEFIENLPNQLSYTLSLERNANILSEPAIQDIVDNPMNFIYFEGGLSAKMNMEIPMTFASNNLTLVDTTDLDLSGFQSQEQINSGMFTIIVENGFPFDATLSLDLLDENGNLLTTLMTSQTATTGTLNNNGVISQSTTSYLNFNISEDILPDVLNASQIAMRVSFTTADAPNHIKIYSYYNLGLKLTADFNYNVNN